MSPSKKKKTGRKTTQPSLFDAMEDIAEFGGEDSVSIHEAARERYLNYALSVITSRALPDVRDGLKPVQRRIRNKRAWRVSHSG